MLGKSMPKPPCPHKTAAAQTNAQVNTAVEDAARKANEQTFAYRPKREDDSPNLLNSFLLGTGIWDR